MAKTKKKQNDQQRFMNFNSAVLNLKANNDHAIDQKMLQITQQFTSTLSGMQHKLAILEEVLKAKGGVTEQDLKDASLARLEKLQNFIQSDEAAEEGSPIKVSLKEEEVGKEKADEDFRDSFMIVGRKDVHPAIDDLVKGAKAGEKLEVVLPDPDNKEVQRRLTVIVDKVYKKLAGSNNVQNQAEAAS
jgi:hypothetical protein